MPQSDAEDMVERGYDKIAKEYSDWRRTFKNRRQLEELAELLPENAQVLDVGCGTGIPATQFLVDRGYRVLGIDISENMLEMARINVPQAQFIKKDMTDLDFAESSFDGLTAFYSIIHVLRTNHEKLFQDLHRILKPGAPMLVSLGRNEWEGTEDFHGAHMFWSHYGPEKSLRLIKQAGFEIVSEGLVADGGEIHYWVTGKKM
jgi:ubiquinone/menaquinone biosynthesis C-methylase UbiE